MTGSDEVLEALDDVVLRAREAASPVGYFATMYRAVTAKVREGITSGFFDDSARMDQLVGAFAGRYLAALRLFEAGQHATRSWELALQTTRSPRVLVLQQLLVGVNAHINLDLGIATAETAPGAALPTIRRDFDRINEILAMALEGMERAMVSISPCLALLDRLGGRHDDEVIRFSIEKARAGAWRFATELAPLDRGSWAGPIGARDARVAQVGRVVLNPGFPLTGGLAVIWVCEAKDVRRNIDVLSGADEPGLAAVDARVRDERATVRQV